MTSWFLDQFSVEIILADFYHIKCIGQKPNSSILMDLSPTAFNDNGHIIVRPTLQVQDPSLTHVFAAGDVSDANDQRNSLSAMEQAVIVSQNIVNLIRRKKLISYHPQCREIENDLPLSIVSRYQIHLELTELTYLNRTHMHYT